MMRTLIACTALLVPVVFYTTQRPLDITGQQIVDLSHSYGADTVYWPTSPSKFKLEALASGQTPGGYFYSANALCTPEHGGTHLDAPFHFFEKGLTTDKVPLQQLIAPAVVVDISKQSAADRDYRLTREDVVAFEKANGRIERGTIVLLRTGWSARWPDRKKYFGDDTPGSAANLHFPSYGAEAAKLLVEDRRVGVLGVDTASIDYGPSKDFAVHRLAAAANVPGLENLAGLEALPETGAWVFALPMKIAGGSGGPARVIALLP